MREVRDILIAPPIWSIRPSTTVRATITTTIVTVTLTHRIKLLVPIVLVTLLWISFVLLTVVTATKCCVESETILFNEFNMLDNIAKFLGTNFASFHQFQ